MFQRIKNLLDISRYTVAELQRKKPVMFKTSSDSMFPHSHEYSPATIINMNEEDPFKEIPNDSSQQPLDDTTPRNG